MADEIKNGAVIEVPTIASDQLVSIAEQAEKRIQAVKKIKSLALAITNKHDWTDQQGKPYLQVSGAEKVGRLFGISWRFEEPELVHEEGGHFMYTYKGEFSLAGQTIEAIGSRSSKDGFFKKYAYPEGEERVELPPSEIDKGDVKKSAYTNCVGNGVTRILGIRNLTWSEVEEFAKVRREDVAQVKYKDRKPPPAQRKKPEPKQTDYKRFLDSIAELKKELNEKTGSDDVYYAVLKQAGVEKANQVKASDRETQKKIYRDLQDAIKILGNGATEEEPPLGEEPPE